MKNYLVTRFTVFLVLVTVCIGCGKPKGLEYKDVMNFKMNSLSMSESVISADLKFYNPNNFRMKLKRAEMDITINNKFLGHSTLDTLMDIPRSDTFLIPVQLKVDVKSLISSSIAALLSDEVDVKLDGKARLGKGGIYFNFPFSYQGKQKFTFFQ